MPDPTLRPAGADQPEPVVATRRVPPLVWVIVAVLAAWFVVMAVQRKGHHASPQDQAASPVTATRATP